MRKPARRSASRRRKATVLWAVLVVVAILSRAAYEFNELMTAEATASDTSLKLAKARAHADSGIHVAMAALSNPDAFTNTLNSNPFDNAAFFQAQMVPSNDRLQGRFSIVAPLSRDDGGQTTAGMPFRYGVIDESGKINLNSLLKWDPSGQMGHDLLMKLEPFGMTDDIANSILDWLDPDDDTRTNGAEDNYYQGLDPPYHCKNGPLDSLDELLLVKGVTPQLLYGNDLNRNGMLDPEEDDGSGQVDMGWQAYLTVYTHENNVDSTGSPRIYLNDSDLNSLFQKLQAAALGDDLAYYIIAYRLYGGTAPAAATGATAAPAASATISDADKQTVQTQIQQAMNSGNQQQLKKINSLFDLLNSTVSVTVNNAGTSGSGATGGGANAGAAARNTTTTSSTAIIRSDDGRAVTTVINVTTTTPSQRTISYPCPLNDPNQRTQLLPILLDQMTATQDTDLPGKVNVNTAPQAVLATLPGLTDTDVQSIINTRPDLSSADPPDQIFQTVAWLITEANIDTSKVKSLENQITARTQVYRVQSIGYFDGEGPAVRIEAVIDTNNGRPRILTRRDLTELGKGFDLQNAQ